MRMRKPEKSPYRVPCHQKGRMNPAGADEAGGGAVVVEGDDVVAEVEDPGTGRTLSWG
jgi:hypothetical protein